MTWIFGFAWTVTALSNGDVILHAPPGHAIILIDHIHAGQLTLVSEFRPLTQPQLGILRGTDEKRVFDAGGNGAVTDVGDGEPRDYVVVRSDGRVYNASPPDMQCTPAEYIGRVHLCRPARNPNVPVRLGDVQELSPNDELGFPGENGWPSLIPLRYSYTFPTEPDAEGHLTRCCTLYEHLMLLLAAGW